MESEENRAYHMEKVEIKGEVVEKYEGDGKKKKAPTAMSGDALWSSSGGKRLVAAGSGVSSPRSCQAYKCTADLSVAKTYHRRHRVCEFHAKAPAVVVTGVRQRFCQQCSRFHELSEFDETKRSCRRRLAGHNERRRKHSSADQSHLQSSNVVKGSSAGTESKGFVTE